MDTSIWSQVTPIIISAAALLDGIRARTHQERQQKQDTELALSTAYHNTVKYYALRDSGAQRDMAAENDLAKDWEKAALLVEQYNRQLAQHLELKSRFWHEGAMWSDDQIRAAGISLERIRAESKTLFYPKPRSRRKVKII